MRDNITIAAVVALLLVGAAGVAAADSALVSPAVSESVGYTDVDVPNDVITYSSNPSYVVDASDTTKVREWADAHSDRAVRETVDSDTLVVSAPADHIVAPVLKDSLGSDLSEQSYVTAISYNREMSVVEPVAHLKSESQYDAPTSKWRLKMHGGGEFTTDGVAFSSDISKKPLSESRTAVSADSVDRNGTGVTIAVLDDGLNTANGSLGVEDNIVAARNFQTAQTGLDAVRDEESVYHGTWVTHSIVADPDPSVSNEKYEGVAPAADVYFAKVMEDGGSGSASDIVQGLTWACQNKNVDIVSLSLGSTSYHKAVAEEVKSCTESGTLVVVAAGNSRVVPGMRYINSPADTPDDGVLTVGSTNVAAPSDAKSAYFSSVGPDRKPSHTRGQEIDVAAPGTKIGVKMADEHGNAEVVYLSGTSMSTPIVTGVAALVEESEDLSPQVLRDRIKSTATPVPDAGVTEVGDGMINASNAVSEQYTNESQEDVQTGYAASRDTANRVYAGMPRLTNWLKDLF